jgi:hypothetical protein
VSLDIFAEDGDEWDVTGHTLMLRVMGGYLCEFKGAAVRRRKMLSMACGNQRQSPDGNDPPNPWRATAGVPIEPLFLCAKQGNIWRMAFTEGQQVRVKRGQASGVVARKLAYLQDMYVVHLDGNHTPAKKLAHESDLELVIRADKRMSA